MYPFPGGYPSFCFMGYGGIQLDTTKNSSGSRAGSISFSSLAGAATRAVADRRGSSRTLDGEIMLGLDGSSKSGRGKTHRLDGG